MNKRLAELVVEYGDLQLVDGHNHDASGYAYSSMLATWEKYSVDRIVLFGDVSDPSAIRTDEIAWKTKDPMDGVLPDIYKLCAEYKTPVFLHIDPPSGEPVGKLEEALENNPDTIFIFAISTLIIRPTMLNFC
ncbi:hypothetical protein [Paenibacillus sp. EZ-K15]|uniref:hypothetical protein n=1 Tax=Paenibacillus sp. EZ-K15 TaxID=2044275 RepID=UPI000BF4363C|nr:hypothetical protein [Paenibacillus sp. EZ-K15]